MVLQLKMLRCHSLHILAQLSPHSSAHLPGPRAEPSALSSLSEAGSSNGGSRSVQSRKRDLSKAVLLNGLSSDCNWN